MIAAFFNQAAEAATGLIGVLTSSANGVETLVWNATSGQPTFMGVLFIISLGSAVVYGCIRLVRNLIRGRG